MSSIYTMPSIKDMPARGNRTANGYILDEVIDVSLLGLVTFGVLPPRDARVVKTV